MISSRTGLALYVNPFTPISALIDFTLSNTRRFYSSMGNPSGVKGLTCTSFLCVGLQHGLSKVMQIIKLLEENKQVVFIFCFYLCNFFFHITFDFCQSKFSKNKIILFLEKYYHYKNSGLSVWKRRPVKMPLWLCITICLITLKSVMTTVSFPKCRNS